MKRILLAIILLTSMPALAQEPAPKAAIPDDAAQKAALTVIADVYKPDYEKAKTPAQKIELAKKLLGEGVATKDDPTSRFVLFRIARDIAAQQGDFVTAFDAIGRIGTEFDADTLQMKVDAGTIAVKALKTPKDHQACAAILAPLIDEAVAADRYAQAKSLASLALGSAREGRDSDRIKQLVAKVKEIEEVAVEFDKVKEAKVALDAKPTDAAANFAVGRFLCLVKGDWKRGITMLALSENEEFRAAALLELEAQPDALKVGDGWWKVAESLEATAKSRAQAHAGEWYRKALPGLSGLTKARVEKVIAQVPLPKQDSVAEAKSPSIDLLSELDTKAGTQLGDWITDRSGLVGGSATASKMNLGKTLNDDYDLEVFFTFQGRDKSGGSDLILGLPLVNDHLCLRSQEGKTAVFLFGAADETAKKRLHPIDLRIGGKYQAKIEVRDGGRSLKVLVDGTALFSTSDNAKANRESSTTFMVTLSPNTKVSFSRIVAVPVEVKPK
jgi:hypothetical protein